MPPVKIFYYTIFIYSLEIINFLNPLMFWHEVGQAPFESFQSFVDSGELFACFR